MFYVHRNIPAPACLSSKEYNNPMVTTALKKIFYGKCYLCEQARLSDPEIEHFIPHQGNEDLMYDWDNLFYSCSRCNSVKGARHVNLLNCCDMSLNVEIEIQHLVPSLPTEDVIIRANSQNPSAETSNTILLLKECFNSTNTGLRGITRENLIEKLLDYFSKYMRQRQILINLESTEDEITHAKASLKAMCKVAFPFSIFWRWHISLDSYLLGFYPNLKIEIGI